MDRKILLKHWKAEQTANIVWEYSSDGGCGSENRIVNGVQFNLLQVKKKSFLKHYVRYVTNLIDLYFMS